MGSLFTTSKDSKIKTTFGKGKFIPFYLQFVPGVCVETITSKNKLKAFSDIKNVNSILAQPHIREGRKKKKTELNNSDRYFPLLRGMFEVPAKGDPVLLCTVGGKNYYLGPLNTNNSPNWNEDNMWEPEIPQTSDDKKSQESNPRLVKGESLNFVKKTYNRMGKNYNQLFDLTEEFNETHGDLMLEGRHGNSVRVGSRGETPYIYISNGRQQSFTQEGFADGTLISITNKGNLSQHFGGYGRKVTPPPSGYQAALETIDGFILSSDYVSLEDGVNNNNPNRLMSSLITSVNGEETTDSIIYKYGSTEDEDENGETIYKPVEANQILFRSDRITIDSKSNDIYLSSGNDIHIGTKRHLTLSTNNDFIVESERIYFGNPNVPEKEVDNMVMGKKLQKVLKDIISLFDEIVVDTSFGPSKMSELALPNRDSVVTAIDGIISSKYFLDK